MATVLRIHDGLGDIAIIRCSEGGTPVIHHCDPAVLSDLLRLTANGLHELVGEREKRPRHTHPGHPRFMLRLAKYLRRQFSFTVEMSRDG